MNAKQRSEIMRSVGRENTGPEIIVRRVAHKLGLRFRIQRKDLPGTPDIVFVRQRICLFVHGCFWHRHMGCCKASTPKSNQEFWLKKFADNVNRDNRVEQELKALGWRVITIWECETVQIERLAQRLQQEIV